MEKAKNTLQWEAEQRAESERILAEAEENIRKFGPSKLGRELMAILDQADLEEKEAWTEEKIESYMNEARITPEALAVIRHAAEIQGRSLSDFITSAAQEVAHRVIEEEHITQLSMEDQKRFAKLLLDPPELSPAMLRAKEAHKRLIRESR